MCANVELNDKSTIRIVESKHLQPCKLIKSIIPATKESVSIKNDIEKTKTKSTQYQINLNNHSTEITKLDSRSSRNQEIEKEKTQIEKHKQRIRSAGGATEAMIRDSTNKEWIDPSRIKRDATKKKREKEKKKKIEKP